MLAECVISQLFQRVYDTEVRSATPEDLYRLFMIFAISSITTYRRGQTQEHPYGYFRAAQRYSAQVPLSGTLEGVQNLLLVARFAMYYHVDCSIWDMARFCIRQCILLGLHRPPATPPTPIEEQTMRNVFWDCYVHDRYSSGILGRPYAIAEHDISVELPLELSEKEILISPSSSLREISAQMNGLPSAPNAASVFCFVVRLRRILTRISTCFYGIHGHGNRSRHNVADAGKIRLQTDLFMNELSAARATAPVFATPPRSLYERQEWYDFLVEKDKLTLIRGSLSRIAVDALHPPLSLLHQALRCATSVINMYNNLFREGRITWTRSYYQILFSSGLSIMYTISLLKQGRPDSGSEQEAMFAEASSALSVASELMKLFVSEMPDAAGFANVFDVLVKQYSTLGTGTGTRARPSRTGSPRAHETSGLQNTGLDVASSQSATANLQPMPDGQAIESFDAMTGLPTLYNNQLRDHSTYNFGLELDFDDFQNWPLYPANTDSIIGQVEAGLGEYAWGMLPDQWDFRGMS
jgi:hypothetical protein